MAGGKRSRMGSDKGLLPFREKLLAQYTIDLLKPFCSELLISSQNIANLGCLSLLMKFRIVVLLEESILLLKHRKQIIFWQ